MNLDYVREFVTLCETKNFIETAERLFSTQSTISKHLKTLEKEIGASLFHRTSRRVELSEYGRHFLPYARSLVDLEDNYQSSLYQLLNQESHILSIGSIPVMAQYGITEVIMQFKKDNPHVVLQIEEGEASAIKALLREGQCEIVFARDTQADDSDLIKIPFYTDHMIALLPQDHPLAGQDLVRLSDLETEDFVFLKENTYIHDLSLSLCREAGFSPSIALTSHRMENIIDFVAKGMGIALLMKQQALFRSGLAVTAVEIAPTAFNDLSLMYLKNRALSPAAQHFIRTVHIF